MPDSRYLPSSQAASAFVGLTPFIVLAMLNGLYNPWLFEASVSLFWLVDFIHYWAIPLAALYFLYRHAGLTPRDYGLARANRYYPAWEMLGAGIFVAALLVAVSTVSWHLGTLLFGWSDYAFSFGMVVPEGGLRVLVVLYLAITAGFVEEVMYRGLMWTALSRLPYRRLAKFIYIVPGSMIFALVHWEQGVAGIFSAFAFGVVAAMLYLSLKNLWPMIAAHTLVDVYYFW